MNKSPSKFSPLVSQAGLRTGLFYLAFDVKVLSDFLEEQFVMAFVTAQDIVQQWLRETAMSLETFCNLQFESPRINRWVLDRILKGDRSVDELTEGPRLVRLVQACRAFQLSMPVDIDWTDPRVRIILARDYKATQDTQPQVFDPGARA